MKNLVIITIICVFASVLLSSSLISRQTIFGFDQARDAFEARTIWYGHHIKIQGPTSDIPGVHHGVLWYYLLAVPYAINDSPVFASFFWAAILLLTAVPWAFLIQSLFKNRHLTLMALSFYLLSPMFLAFTHWLNNPILGLIATPLLLGCLWHYLQRKDNLSAFFVGVFFGILINADIAWGLYLFTIPVFLYYFKVIPTIKNVVSFFVGLLFACSTLLVSEIHFRGKGVIAFTNYLLNLAPNDLTPTKTLVGTLDKIALSLHNLILPVPFLLVFTFILILGILIYQKRASWFKQRKGVAFLSIWSGGILLFYLFPSGFIGSPFMTAPVVGSILTLFAVFLYSLNLRRGFIIILLIYAAATINWMRADTSPLALQKGINYQWETKILDYTYQSSRGKPFTITTITAPLYINSLWAYLYQTYGEKKYGYLPFWIGKDQTGYLGNLPQGKKDTEFFYLISEPMEAIPEMFAIKVKYEADKISDTIEEKKFGFFLVQKRRFVKNKVNVPTPANLPASVLLDPLL